MEQECPVCRKAVGRTLPDGKPNRHFPFCCRRCQLIDLGAWFDGRYRVPQESDQPAEPGEEAENA